MMKSKRKIKIYLETNDNENTTIQNLWGAAKAVFRGKFTVIQAFLKEKKKKEGKRKNLKQPTLLLKKLQKEQTKPKVTGRKEIIKIGEEINRD